MSTTGNKSYGETSCSGGSDGQGATERKGNAMGGGGGGLLSNAGRNVRISFGSHSGTDGGMAFVNGGVGGGGLPDYIDGGFGGGGGGLKGCQSSRNRSRRSGGPGGGGGGGYSGGGGGCPWPGVEKGLSSIGLGAGIVTTCNVNRGESRTPNGGGGGGSFNSGTDTDGQDGANYGPGDVVFTKQVYKPA
ncbi:loricrin-like [Branchiostoma lanceolatum]|uniref:loricrin-like n=1 Tax=Branchiostoma lanceolatum TaxID=7740 RepID=UPI0034547D7F